MITGLRVERGGDGADALGQGADEELARRGDSRAAQRVDARAVRRRRLRSGCTSAIGWTPICSLMMNSMRARPTPAFGIIAVRNARSGLPRLTMIVGLRQRQRARIGTRVTSNGSVAVIDRADLAAGAGDGDALRRSSSAVVAFSAPTTAGTPSSRATMAAWQVRPPWSVTMAPAVFITGSQSGLVELATSTSPGRKARRSRGAVDDPHGAGADLLADRLAGHQHLAARRSARRFRTSPAGAPRRHRLRPRLHDVELAVARRPSPIRCPSARDGRRAAE